MQWRPRDDAQSVLLRRGNDFQLDGAGEQVVDGLFADQTGVVAPGGGGLRLGDVPAGEVAAARVQDLALLDGHLDGLPDLIPRGVPVNVVELVDVDVVRLEALEAGIQCPADVESREPAVIGPVRHTAEQLGGQHRVLTALTALGKPAAEDLFGPATVLGSAIHIGSVKEVDPRLLGGIHDGVGGRHLGLRTKIHGAQAQTRDGQAGTAKMRVLHVRSPFNTWFGYCVRRQQRPGRAGSEAPAPGACRSRCRPPQAA